MKSRAGMADGRDHATTQVVVAHSDHASQLPNPGETDYLFVMSETPALKRPPKPRIIFEVTPKLLDQIRERAMGQGLTLTAYMMKLLAADGLDVHSRQPFIDGRTLRGKNRERRSA